jgi:hypothetical protein
MADKEMVVYDYKTIRVDRSMETVAQDAYIAMGWAPTGAGLGDGAIFNVNLSFKRDRNIRGKQNLLKIQEQIDLVLSNIDIMQKVKKRAGNITAWTAGAVGALILGGSINMLFTPTESLLFNNFPLFAGGVALGAAGFGICCLGWYLHGKIKRSKAAKITPLIEAEYDELADLITEAYKCLRND